MGARWQHTTGPAQRSLASRRANGLLAAGLFAAFELPRGVIYMPTVANGIWAITGAVMTLTVAMRRRNPVRVWAIVTACAAFLLETHAQLGPWADSTGLALMVFPAPLVALYTLARRVPARGRLGLVVSLIALGLPLLFDLSWLVPGVPQARVPQTYPGLAVIAAGMLITAWALGETMHARGESAAVRLAAEEAERAEHDRAVAAGERARIARELHDITAHHISVVTLQAGAARLLAESGQSPSIELLIGIETAGRQAMTEIRQALGVIRSSPDGAAPLPGVARLPELARRMSLAGLSVTIDGSAGPLPGSLDLTAYRIVQEGLTNVARHSAAGSARVTFRRGHGALVISVADDGPPRGGPPAVPGGHGLIGLRERVARYGGELRAGPRPGGGFDLRAALPVRDAAADWLPSDLTVPAREPSPAEPSP